MIFFPRVNNHNSLFSGVPFRLNKSPRCRLISFTIGNELSFIREGGNNARGRLVESFYRGGADLVTVSLNSHCLRFRSVIVLGKSSRLA